MSKSIFHSINACEVLTTMFLLPKKEQASFLRQFMIDLSRDDITTAITDAAKEVILRTDERRGKASKAGTKSAEVRQARVSTQAIEQKDGLLDELSLGGIYEQD